MIINHKDYLTYELPKGWRSEVSGDDVVIYSQTGNGAMVLSFFSLIELKDTLDEQISIMAKKFIDNNKITLNTPLILFGSRETKLTLFGTGITVDNWFIKLWVIAKYPKIVFVSYQCEKKTSEVKKCDDIVESMKFLF